MNDRLPSPSRPAPRDDHRPALAAVRSHALRLLARRDYSRVELERKLAAALRRAAASRAKAGHDGADADAQADSGRSEREIGQEIAQQIAQQIEQVLDELAARGLLSDERAAEALVAGRAPRFGRRRLEQVLQQRGLAGATIAAALAPLRASELERARAIWRRRFGGTPPRDAAERARQMRFLAGRGFEADTIRRLLAGAGEEDEG